MRIAGKPHIRVNISWNRRGGPPPLSRKRWLCIGEVNDPKPRSIMAYGDTPRLAYLLWAGSLVRRREA